MTIVKLVENGSVRVRVRRGGGGRTRTTPARKGLRSGSRVCSLKQPALVANLRSQIFQNGMLFFFSFRRLQTRNVTYPFSEHEHGASPRRCRLGFTVEALATYAARKLHRCIVRVNERVGCGSGDMWIYRAPRTDAELRRWGGKFWGTRIVSAWKREKVLARVTMTHMVMDQGCICWQLGGLGSSSRCIRDKSHIGGRRVP